MSDSPIKDFTSIHGHSHFSLLDGICTPEEIVLAAKEKGLRSVALTDHGHAGGHADFYLAGKKHGVKTILGVEGYIINDLDEWNKLREGIVEARKAKGKSTSDAETDEIDDGDIDVKNRRLLRRKGHLVMLARNREGLENIYKITHLAHKLGMYGKPRADKKMLIEHSKGIVTSSACMGGVISNKCWELKRGECTWEEVVKEAKEFDEIFGRGSFYLEMQLNESDSQRYINDCMVKIHKETGIPLSITTDFHYTNPDDWEAQEVLYMLRGNKTVATRGPNWDFEVKQLYLKSGPEMWESFKRFGGDLDPKIAEEAFRNTLLIDSMVEEFEPDTHQRLPTLPIQNPFKELGMKALDEMKRRGLDRDERYSERILKELRIIKEKGISNYFLIVREIISRAKKQMLVGPGRGSAAGSLVCYMLGITDLDPIEHNLLFERFINPDRVELPDIDIDFQDADEAKKMLAEIFGDDNVAALSTWGTFQIKGLLKDLGRIYDVDHNEVNRINKRIEAELRVLYKDQDKSTIVIKLDDVRRVSKTFNDFMEAHPEIDRQIAKLYGRNRHVGRHACGVIIGDNLPAETAVFTSKGTLQASFTEGIVNKNISAMGFVKFDILSLATLKVIDHTLKLISDRTGKDLEELKESIRPHRIDFNDQTVLKKIFWQGNFAGIFQFSEKGIRKLAMRIKPDCFNDVSAVTSLYRPGPLGSGMDKLYYENKHHPEGTKYDHPLLEEILKETHGCIVYQEQLMQVCSSLGKMSMKDVNRVRKVLLKKDKSKSEEFLKKEGDELRGKFIQGCAENGYPKDKAEELWKNLLYFGGYGFNAAHSKAYSMVTYQTAYLSTYHPLEFYSAVLTCAQSGDLQDYVGDIKKRGVRILPVDVNMSKASHVIERLPDGSEGIRLSLSSVLGVGPSAISKIVANQPYTDMKDFLLRSGATKTSISPLIMVGALNCFGDNVKLIEKRYELFTSNPKFKNKTMRAEFEKQFDALPIPKDYEQHELMFFENQLMGFSLRGSPFEVFDRGQKILELIEAGSAQEFKEWIESDELVGVVPVAVREVRERAQSKGGMMAFLKFADKTGQEFEAPCFAQIWRNISSKVRPGNVYLVTFNRKEEGSTDIVVGKPGFAHSMFASQEYFLSVDDIQL